MKTGTRFWRLADATRGHREWDWAEVRNDPIPHTLVLLTLIEAGKGKFMLKQWQGYSTSLVPLPKKLTVKEAKCLAIFMYSTQRLTTHES